jgi:hypothetical protein
MDGLFLPLPNENLRPLDHAICFEPVSGVLSRNATDWLKTDRKEMDMDELHAAERPMAGESKDLERPNLEGIMNCTVLEAEQASSLQKELLDCPGVAFVSGLIVQRSNEAVCKDAAAELRLKTDGSTELAHLATGSTTRIQVEDDIILDFLGKLVSDNSVDNLISLDCENSNEGQTSFGQESKESWSGNQLYEPLHYDLSSPPSADDDRNATVEDHTPKDEDVVDEEMTAREEVLLRPAENTRLNLEDELDAFILSRGSRHVCTGGVGQLTANLGRTKKLDAATQLLLGKRGINTTKVVIDSDTPIALTAFILRCLSCAVLGQLVEKGIVYHKNIVAASADNDLILDMAGSVREALADNTTSSKQKARATLAWSALMFVYLVNKTHAHLINSGTGVAGLFVETALADPKWQSLVSSVAPKIFDVDVVGRLNAMRESKESHPKLAQLAAIVAQRAVVDREDVLLTVVLVRSSVSFGDVFEAIQGLKVEIQSKAASDLSKGQDFEFLQPGKAAVWVLTEQAMLKLLAERNPSCAALELAMVVVLNKPSAGMQSLLQSTAAPFKNVIILETTQPFVEEVFLLSGAKSYSTKVEVQPSIQKLWVDVEEDAAANIVVHRSVKLNIYVNELVVQRRDLVQALLEENVHLIDWNLFGCEIVVSRFMCIVIRSMRELQRSEAAEVDSGMNDLYITLIELGRSFERIVFLAELDEGQEGEGQEEMRGIDAAAWVRMNSLFKSCGAVVVVRF